MDNIYKLQQRAEELSRRRQTDSISPDDTFGLTGDVIQYVAELERNLDGLGVRRIYKNTAEMQADGSAPVGSNGKALRLGQLVCVFDKDNQALPENGDIYSWQGGESAWQKIGNIGNIYPLEEGLSNANSRINRMFTSVDIGNIDNIYPIYEKESLREFFGSGKVGYIVIRGDQLRRVGYLYVMIDHTATFCTQVLLTNNEFNEATQEVDWNEAILGEFNLLTRWRYLRNSGIGWSKWRHASAKLHDALVAQYRRIDGIENVITTLSERIDGIGSAGSPIGTAENSAWYILE